MAASGWNAGRLASGFAAISLLQRVVQLGTFLLLPLILPVAEVGALGAALALNTLFSVVADMGVQSATVRALAAAKAEDRGREAAVLAAALVLRTSLGVVALVLGAVLLLVVPLPQKVELMTLIALVAAVSPFQSVYTAVLQTNSAVRSLGIAGVLTAVITTTVAITVGLLTRDGLPVIAALLGLTSASGLVLMALARRYLRPTWRGVRDHTVDLARQAWRLGATALMVSLYNRADVILLSATSTAQQVAVYYTAYRFAESAYVVVALAGPAALPVLARLYFEDRDRAFRFGLTMLRCFAGVGLVLAAGALLVGQRGLELVYGPDYAESGRLLCILFIGSPLTAVMSCITQVAVVLGNQRLVLRTGGVGLIVTVACGPPLILGLDATGAAIATVITNLACCLAVTPWAIRHFRLPVGRIVLGTLTAMAVLGGAWAAGALLPLGWCLLLTGPTVLALVPLTGLTTLSEMRRLALTAQRRRLPS